MFVIGVPTSWPAGTDNVVVMVRLSPDGIEPREQGNAVVQSPAFDMKVRPVGVGSAISTEPAVSGPAFVTAMV